ncbi:toprim domain-containing protein [Mesorhizobium sp. RP14(2022)]|uniref:Toprim domain-containing protein n=1 Tax=Mesorhizobium liriopis TaxID=2953882 RepID=A0ABT1C3G6_9HYPH|nr:toprim domain-containing protein [Mesorhizobium liriopis]MCO6049359.1 toprim domain-containing protein [Mesorhizobium liriopis]
MSVEMKSPGALAGAHRARSVKKSGGKLDAARFSSTDSRFEANNSASLLRQHLYPSASRPAGTLSIFALRNAARILGGVVLDRGRLLVPGPGHSSSDRSLLVDLFADGNCRVHSFAGDAWPMCKDYVQRRLRLRSRDPLISMHDTRAVTKSAATGASAWQSIWNASQSILKSPAEAYLASRGLQCASGELRWHPSCPFGRERAGCMVALVRNIVTNEPQAIHRTRIPSSGERVVRKALGRLTGGAVKLFENADVTLVLGIGEGIETTLSMCHLPGLNQLPVWACLSATGLKNFPLLAGLEAVWIAADHDKSKQGVTAARHVAHRYQDAGQEALVLVPTVEESDLNDWISIHV